MNKNRVEGAAKTVAGCAKEAVGKTVGDQKMAAEGKTTKAVGKLQNAVGGIQDSIKESNRQSRRP
jgi:uncharacterized protein YjbJ (UPF0337 family)